MTINEHIAKHGERKTAIKLVSQKIYNIVGLSVEELPDTQELCSLYDDLEVLLKDFEKNEKTITDLLNDIDLNFIENVLY